MDARRPFTDPVSVSLAGLALLALAAASFTSALTHQLRLPRPVGTATVVVQPAAEPPPLAASPGLALLAPVETPPPKLRRSLRPAPAAEPTTTPGPLDGAPQLPTPAAASAGEITADAAESSATSGTPSGSDAAPSTDAPPARGPGPGPAQP